MIPALLSFSCSKQGCNAENMLHAGAQVGNVELPPWAADAQDFVAQMAEALESPHVSRSLHRWIDLIFGCRNQGQAALAADNVFHHLTYDSMCALLG